MQTQYKLVMSYEKCTQALTLYFII